MTFLTIHLASGLSRSDRARARADGRRAVDTRGSHSSMLQRAGFDLVVERDVTRPFLETAHAWLREPEARTDELAALGPGADD